jgi:glucose-6-phosphate isomerase
MDADVKIGSHRSEPASLSYLGGQAVGHLLEAERRATTEALRQNGRPTMTLEIDGLDAEALGELLMLMSISTVYAGALYGVDPLGQPGVELGKRLTYGLLGREGFEGHALPDSDPRWRV